MNRLVIAIIGAIIGVSMMGSAAAQKGGQKPHARQVFVHVADQQGAPVLDLASGDFEITEGGTKRTVVRAGLAKSPMRVALIVDTGDGAAPALIHLRAGLLGFLDGLPPDAEVLMVSTGRQTRVRVQPTTDRKKLKDAAGGLFSDGGATVLSDTLLEVDDRFMRKAEDRWPVFVIITSDGADGSTGANEKKFNDWLLNLPARGISAHAFALKYKGGGQAEIVASHVAQSAGGKYEFMNTSNSLPEKLTALGSAMAASAKQMSTWYQVEFQTDAAGNGPVEVGVARAGIKIQLSYRRQ